MWGQDYPHIEGTYPYTTEALRNTFAGLPVDEVAPMVGLTAVEVYDFDLDVLAPVAERVGPTVDEVDVPLDEIPADSLLDRVRGRGRQAVVSEVVSDQPYLVVSSDGHAGPPPEQYRQYMDPQHRAALRRIPRHARRHAGHDGGVTQQRAEAVPREVPRQDRRRRDPRQLGQ